MQQITIEVVIQNYGLSKYIRISSLDSAVRVITESSLKPVLYYTENGYGKDARNAATDGAVNILKIPSPAGPFAAGLLYAVVIQYYTSNGYGSDAVTTATKAGETILSRNYSTGVDVVKILFDMCIDYYTTHGYGKDAKNAADKFSKLVIRYAT